jgi:ribosomal protein L19
MKNTVLIPYMLTAVFFFCSTISFSQKNKEKPLDSALEANSEKWKVKQHRPLFGIAKPSFGTYITIDAIKLDSPVIRRKTKDGSATEISFSSQGWDLDISKFQTLEKKKIYMLKMATGTDTMEVMFAVHAISKEKSQTFAGKLLSKNDEGKDEILAYKKIISGIITTRLDSAYSKFYLEDYLSTTQTAERFSEKPSITQGYILTGTDSLFTEPIMHAVGKPSDKYFFEWQRGIFINSTNDVRIAALKFTDGQSPFYIWIRKDIEAHVQQSIAAFFSILIGTMDL